MAFISKSNEKGYILPMVAITALIIGAGLMALLARSISFRVGSIRQGLNQKAREAAESGMAVIIKELNTNFPYIMINDCYITSTEGSPFCTGWSENQTLGGTFQYITSSCPNSTIPPDTVFNSISGVLPGSTGSYRLVSYDFDGDQNQGGIATIQVSGKSISAGTSTTYTQSEAWIQQEINIIPKTCTDTDSGYPGLLAESVSFGNLDIVGGINANVACTSCDPNQTQAELEDEINLKKRGFVEGQIYGGQLPIPEPPPFPGFPDNYETDYGIVPCSTTDTCDINAETTIIAGDDNDGRCFLEASTNITHCKVDSVDLSGGDDLIVNTSGTGSPEPSIRLYVTGDFQTSGNSGMVHYQDSSNSTLGDTANLAIFGNKRSESSVCSQDLLIGGTSDSLNAFFLMPDACAGINGGGNATPNVRGTIWVRDFGTSNSNAGTIEVPPDDGGRVCTKFGINFCIAIREYSGRGANKWSLVTKPN